MREHPILFSTPMVKAILEGHKTQTRRVIPSKYPVRTLEELREIWGGLEKYSDDILLECRNGSLINRCPYGQVGDRLWVRETFIADYAIGGQDESGKRVDIIYKASWDKNENGKVYGWKPSIHMFRKYSRITLEITDIRVQRVQEIRETDALAEGCQPYRHHQVRGVISAFDNIMIERSASFDFQRLWDSINSKRGYGWSVNTWVWCLTFNRIKQEG